MFFFSASCPFWARGKLCHLFLRVNPGKIWGHLTAPSQNYFSKKRSLHKTLLCKISFFSKLKCIKTSFIKATDKPKIQLLFCVDTYLLNEKKYLIMHHDTTFYILIDLILISDYKILKYFCMKRNFSIIWIFIWKENNFRLNKQH